MSCHPDKNPDNPNAEESFHQLMEAVEILTNSKSRKDYDLLVKAREYQRLRQREKRQREKKKFREIEEQMPQYWELEGSLNPSMPID